MVTLDGIIHGCARRNHTWSPWTESYMVILKPAITKVQTIHGLCMVLMKKIRTQAPLFRRHTYDCESFHSFPKISVHIPS